MTASTNHLRRAGTTLLLGAALVVPTAGTALAQPARDPQPAGAVSVRGLGTDVAAEDQQAPVVASGASPALAQERYYSSFGDSTTQIRPTSAPITPDDSTDPLLIVGLSLAGVVVAGGTVATARRRRHHVPGALA